MTKKTVHILFFVATLLFSLCCVASVSYAAAASCHGAKTSVDLGDVTQANTYGMFDRSVLVNMKRLLVDVYSALSYVQMFGHSLVCYSRTHNLGAQKWKLFSIFGVGPYFWIWDFSMLLCGCIIYVVGFFMLMAVGMYFIDVSFKIGFALLMFPVSIALWPFKPTSKKFTDNLSILIRNSMLFTVVAIAVCYAVELVMQGIDLDAYWVLVEQGEKQAHEVKDLYSLFTVKFLVIAFCLIFGFKMLSSGVENYLDYFFQDATFGKESPMHHMGTQAVGMAFNTVAKPVAETVGRGMLNLGGKTMVGLGNGLDRMAEGDFSDIKNIAHAISNPGETLSDAYTNLSNKAVKGMGNLAKDVHDWGLLLKPGHFYSEEYHEKRDEYNTRVDDWVQNHTKQPSSTDNSEGNENQSVDDVSGQGGVSSAGGQTSGQSSSTIADSDIEVRKEKASFGEDGTLLERASFKSNNQAASLKTIKSDGSSDEITYHANGKMKTTTHLDSNGIIRREFDEEGNMVKELTADNEGNGHLRTLDADGKVTDTELKNDEDLKNSQQHDLEANRSHYQDQKDVKAIHDIFDPNQAPISLQPSALLSGLGAGAGGLVNTIDTLAKIAFAGSNITTTDTEKQKEMKDIWQNSELFSAYQNLVRATGNFNAQLAQSPNQKFLTGTRLVIKKSGQVAARTVKGTAQDAAHLTGGIFRGFGNVMLREARAPRKSGYQRWKEKEHEEAERRAEEAAAREINRSIADNYE